MSLKINYKQILVINFEISFLIQSKIYEMPRSGSAYIRSRAEKSTKIQQVKGEKKQSMKIYFF